MIDTNNSAINAEEMVKAVKEVVKNSPEISQSQYQLWFSGIKAERFANNTLYITVPGTICYDVVQKKYTNLITTIIYDLFDLNVDLFVINEEDRDRTDPFKAQVTSSVVNPYHHINKQYTFENFVVGNTNRAAYEAAQVMAIEESGFFPSIYIYGGPGLGKTHLMHAIGNKILELNPETNILYVTCEEFGSDFVNLVIRDKKSHVFQEKYRTVDVLLIDDVQFLKGKDSTQEEFFHTYNTLLANNKKMIFTSDKPPKDITGLEERLVGRLTNGFITEILPPDYEMRVVITKNKAEENDLEVPDELIDYIAEQVMTNVRDIEGVLNHLKVTTRMNKTKVIDKENVDKALHIYKFTTPDFITPEVILETVSRYLGISKEDILSQRRTKDVVYARHLCMYFTKRFTKLTLKEISAFYKRNDHTTALHAIDNIEAIVAKNDKDVLTQITDITNNIKKD